MLKRPGTPSTKQKQPIRIGSINKLSKQIKNPQPIRPTLSRNSSSSRITFDIQKFNPQSAERIKKINITDQMRKKVVEWMLEVAHYYSMHSDSIFMAVKLFDMGIINVDDIGYRNVQLLATTCLFMASKYEEVSPQPLKRFLEVTLNSYKKNEVVNMQQKILSIIGFRLKFQTRFNSFNFLMEHISTIPTSAKLKYVKLVTMLLQLSLLQKWQNSEMEMAEAAMFLASKVLKLILNGNIGGSDSVIQASYKLMGLWIQNQNSIITYIYSNEKHLFTGAIKLIM